MWVYKYRENEKDFCLWRGWQGMLYVFYEELSSMRASFIDEMIWRYKKDSLRVFA